MPLPIIPIVVGIVLAGGGAVVADRVVRANDDQGEPECPAGTTKQTPSDHLICRQVKSGFLRLWGEFRTVCDAQVLRCVAPPAPEVACGSGTKLDGKTCLPVIDACGAGTDPVGLKDGATKCFPLCTGKKTERDPATGECKKKAKDSSGGGTLPRIQGKTAEQCLRKGQIVNTNARPRVCKPCDPGQKTTDGRTCVADAASVPAPAPAPAPAPTSPGKTAAECKKENTILPAGKTECEPCVSGRVPDTKGEKCLFPREEY